ncbi:MAG: LysR family transcriptional regulator [Myxococcota bacterium]
MRSVDRLVELLAIVEAGSIAAAAEKGGMTRSTLSRRLSSLERELGVRLVHRDSRRLSLTYAGELLVKRARRIAQEADLAWQEVRAQSENPSGPLRISTPPSAIFTDLLVDFAVAFPSVRVLVESTHRHVNLLENGIDVALRFGEVTEEGLIARRFGNARSSLVASPAYLAVMGRPRDLAALTEHRCVVGYGQSGLPDPAWPLWTGESVAVRPHFACEGVQASLRAAIAGLGIALLPDPYTNPHRERGALEFVLEDVVGMSLSGQLVYPSRQHVLPAVRAFVDFTVAYYRERTPRGPDL